MKRLTVTSSPDIVSGAPVFAGTPVPVQALIDYLEGGETIDDFLEGFPTVSREQVVAFLDEAMEQVATSASVADDIASRIYVNCYPSYWPHWGA
jgi:uncharacterized protein (DUF433 family)